MLKDTDWLILSGNNLGSLNKAPDYLENITFLNLSSSNIREIDETVMEAIVKSVKSLDITRNYLKEIPPTVRKAVNNSKRWISDNPYECNCNMMWMKHWLVDTKSVMDKDNVLCSGHKMKGERKQFSIYWFTGEIKNVNQHNTNFNLKEMYLK